MRHFDKPVACSRAQRGAVTLVVTVLILLAMGLGAIALIASSAMETRMSANDLRGRQASQAAQAGVDYLVAALGQTTLNKGFICSKTTRTDYGFVLDFGVDAAGAKIECGAVPFQILTKLDSVRSWGYSADGESVRVIESTIDLSTPWNFGTPAGTQTGGGGLAAVITKDSADFQGTPETARCNTGSGQASQCKDLATSGNQTGIIEGTLVRAGGDITTGGNVPMKAENLASNDADIQAMDTDKLFSEFFGGGLSKEQFINGIPGVGGVAPAYKYTSTGSKDDVSDVGANAGSNQNIYVTGDLTLRNATLGSESKPVALYVDGALNLAGNVIIWGVVYSKDTKFSQGTNKILGGLVSEGPVEMGGNAAVYANPGLRPDPTTVDPSTLLANQTGRTSSVRIGSWRELSLSEIKN